MLRLLSLTPRQVLIVLHDLVATAVAVVLTFYIRFEDTAFDTKLAGLKYPAALPGLCRRRLFRLRPASQQVALHLAAGPLNHRPRLDRAGDLAARARLRSAGAERLRHVLLRQDHDPALLVPADVLPWRHARRLPLFPLRAHAAARQGRRRDADADARPRRRRRSAAARHRKRRGARRSGRSACCRRRRPTAASRSAAFRCSATSTISSAWSPTSPTAARG